MITNPNETRWFVVEHARITPWPELGSFAPAEEAS